MKNIPIIDNLLIDYNVLRVIIMKNAEMVEVQLNNHIIYIGNYWDYHNYCYGGWSDFPKFNNWTNFVKLVEKYVTEKSFECIKIIEYTKYKE